MTLPIDDTGRGDLAAIDIASRREAKRERAMVLHQYMCPDCGYGQWQLYSDGAALCANCNLEADDLCVMQRDTIGGAA